jgi:hypothetical protein
LRERQTISHSHAGFDRVSHVAPADILKIRRDGAAPLHLARLARRIVTIDDVQNGIVGIETRKRRPCTPRSRA